MKNTERIVTSLIDLKPVNKTGELIAFSAGPNDFLYTLVAQKDLDYQYDQQNASFPKMIPDIPQDYLLSYFFEDQLLNQISIKNEPYNIHYLQPLPDEKFLLVCARSCYHGQIDYEKNGRLYNSDGSFQSEILLGDGINDVQTTQDGTIWTSYFDEGIFGDSIGSSGLAAWKADGEKIFKYTPPNDEYFISDCYALNVESDKKTWFYYYDVFKLVCLNDKKIEQAWDIPIHGSSAFAIQMPYLLLYGEYDNRDTCYFFRLEHGGKIELIQTFRLLNTDKNPINAERIFARSDKIWIYHSDNVYRISISDFL